jgi:hypothetical protein
MTRLALVLAVVTVLLPGAARASACSPLDCAPSQFTLDKGRLLAVRTTVQSPLRVVDLATGTTKWRLPAGVTQSDALVHRDANLLTWYDTATGARTGDATLEQKGAFALVGLSQGGTRAVLARTQRRSTTFVLLSPSSSRVLTLGGNTWMFDALSGASLYLTQGKRKGYYVRRYDLRTSTLQKQPLKDPTDGALIEGAPFARASTADGRHLFTLYVAGGRAMIHDLDLVAGTARCIDLPGSGDYNAAITWALVVDPDGRTVWAVSPGYGRVVAVDVATHSVRFSYAFAAAHWVANAGIAVMAPDGEHIAFSDVEHVWLAIPAERRVIAEPAHVTLGLGFAPDQSALWVIGERSRVSRLAPLRWQ